MRPPFRSQRVASASRCRQACTGRPATDRGAECGQFIVGEPPSALGRLVDEETCAYSAKLPPSEAQPQDAARPEDDGEKSGVSDELW
jgi:hypothetical protein